MFRYDLCPITLTTSLYTIPIVTVLFLTLITNIPAAFSEEVITIIPCSSNHNNAKFFDMPSYFIQKGQPIRWYNADDINHRIVITKSVGKGILSNSGIIKPNGSFQYRFDNDGIYNFSSPTYPWMRGNVSVNNDISSVTITNPKINVTVQLTWAPSVPKVGQITHFKIIFIDMKTNKNQKHIDYVFSIDTPKNKTSYQQTLHSSWGVESAAYKFDTAGIFKPRVTIDAILFQPIEPVEDDFKILV
jgi:plastocyanin